MAQASECSHRTIAEWSALEAERDRLRAENERLREVLHTIAVDISKYETDSEGLIWRVKLAHETALTSDEEDSTHV